MDWELFKNDPRSFVIELIDSGYVDANAIVLMLVKYMSHDDVRDCMRANEIHPDFDETLADEEE